MDENAPVAVVIHGFFTQSNTNLPVHLALRRRKYKTYDVEIPGMNIQDPRESARCVRDTINRIHEETGARNIGMVGVSLGGLIGLSYLREFESDEIVNRFVSLGSPFQGTRFGQGAKRIISRLPAVPGEAVETIEKMANDSDLIEFLNAEPVTKARVASVYAKGDPIVTPREARLPWAENLRAPVGNFPLGHYQLVIDPRNLGFVAKTLTRL